MLIFSKPSHFLIHFCLFTVCLFVVYCKQLLLFRKIYVVMRKTICCLWPALRERGSFTCELFVCRTATVVSRLFTLKLPVTRPVRYDCSLKRRALVVPTAGCYDATMRDCTHMQLQLWPWDWWTPGHVTHWWDGTLSGDTQQDNWVKFYLNLFKQRLARYIFMIF